jgi:hypothetical protein
MILSLDPERVMPDILLQERCDQTSSRTVLDHVLRSCEQEPRDVITDKLTSWRATRRPSGVSCRIARGQPGRFTSAIQFHKLRVLEPTREYQLFVFDRHRCPVLPLNDWVSPPPRPRVTAHEAACPAMLCPFPGYLIEHSWA